MGLDNIKASAKESVRRLAITAGLEVAHLLERAGLGNARGRGLIFTLHHVRPHVPDRFSPNAHLEITPEFLDLAIRTVLKKGYEPVSLEQLPERLKAGTNKPVVAFTLDDGYRNNLTHALPVFARHGIPFTVFVTKGFALRTHTIWWETLAELLRNSPRITLAAGGETLSLNTQSLREKAFAFQLVGRTILGEREAQIIEQLDELARSSGLRPERIVEELTLDKDGLIELAQSPLASLGAHTVSHRAVAFLSQEEARRELMESADFVEQLTGIRPKALAYPYGFEPAVSTREHQMAADAGFELAVLTKPGTLSDLGMQHPHALPRVSLNGLYQKARYVSALASGLPFKFGG